MSIVYVWKEGARMRGNAQVVGERIDQIRSAHKGELEPVHVVADARSKGSPLHSLFEWNDRKAAEQHRLQQARNLIGAIEVSFETSRGTQSVRAYVSLPDGPGRKYHRTTDAMSDGSLRQMMLQQAMDDAEQYKARYEKLRELTAIFAAIDKTSKKVRKERVGGARLG